MRRFFETKRKTEIARMSTLKENVQTFIKYFRTFSITLAAALELLGYSYRAIKQRQEYFKQFSYIDNDGRMLFVGSKAEGTSVCIEGDADMMITYNYYICADDIGDKDSSNPALFLLTEMDNLNPGYSKLKVAFPDDLQNLPGTDVVSQSCKPDGDGYVPNTLCKKKITILEGRGVLLDTCGPALSMTYPRFPNSSDVVFAIPYKCSILAQEWLARPRFHGWPSQETLQQLAKLDWHLVPVGPHKDSLQEWRICFTLGELYLVKTFNITQLHLLVILKLVMNKSLKPLCSAFSSYIAKNLVFWMVEILAPENFKVENLSSLLMMSLQMMRTAVENEQLQNYMIPSRNLLKGKMSRDEKETIIKVLDGFIDYGPSFLARQSEYSELQKAMQNVDTGTDMAQKIKRRYTFEKGAFDVVLSCLNAWTSDLEQIIRLYAKMVCGCSSADFIKGEELMMEGFRKFFEGQGLNVTEAQQKAFIDDSYRKLMEFHR